NSDRKATAAHQTNSAETPNHADDIFAAATGEKNTGHNDDSNVAASTTVEKRKYAVKKIAAHVADVQHPAAAATSTKTTVTIDTTKDVGQISNQQPPVQTHVEGAGDIAAAPPTIVVSRQRLRQKSRIRPQIQHKRERQQQRQRERERLVQTQRVYWTESAATTTDDDDSSAGSLAVKKQHYNQYAAQVAASANANANSNANVNTNSNAGVNIAHSKHLSKRVENQNFGYSAPSPIPDMNLNIGPDVVTSALQIPIGILRSLQETLGNLGASKQASVSLNH
ncbi:PREDICTED: uncharacterized protein LOC108363042, partial [Rhagoletis zephyria]|uniref:uncharacterized protein LOC108363042 n=1 Tax=Rhagoletis zephyria TaxID=28612 RepID=UPI0008118E0F